MFKGTPVLHVGLTNDILHSVLKRGCGELQCLDLCGSPQLLTDYAVELIGRYICRESMNLVDGFSIRGFDIQPYPQALSSRNRGSRFSKQIKFFVIFFSTLTSV